MNRILVLLAMLKVGSGKTTLIKYIISALPINPEEDVAYVALTGKASCVLQQKGCPNATTAHKLLYWANPKKDGGFTFKPKPSIDYKVIVVDEISMLPKPMWDLLMKHRKYVIACGDPAQLPPISSADNNHVLDSPHIFLDEIMRQAQDSEIIRLSMWVRQGKPLFQFPFENKQVMSFRASEDTPQMYEWADQVLCATNKKRIEINNIVRERKGFGLLPEAGDKIIGLSNHWDFYSNSGNWALTNGAIGTLKDFYTESFRLPYWVGHNNLEYMFAIMQLEDGDQFTGIPIDYRALITGYPSLNEKQIYLLNKEANKENSRYLEAPYQFAYGYAITTWKAQGSEWDKVLLIEENFPYEKIEHQKFLYTAITRAKEKLVIVRK